MSYEYNDGLCPGGRHPHLWIVALGQIHSFEGTAIPGVVAVLRTAYDKCGKWSSTTYQLQLAGGATPCHLLAPLHGQVWPEHDRRAAHERFMRSFEVAASFEVFNAALQRHYPQSHARMLEGEAAIAAVSGELMEISMSSASDVRVVADGRTWLLAHEAPVGTEVPGVCKIVGRRFRPSHRGGTTTIVFAVRSAAKIEAAD